MINDQWSCTYLCHAPDYSCLSTYKTAIPSNSQPIVLSGFFDSSTLNLIRWQPVQDAYILPRLRSFGSLLSLRMTAHWQSINKKKRPSPCQKSLMIMGVSYEYLGFWWEQVKCRSFPDHGDLTHTTPYFPLPSSVLISGLNESTEFADVSGNSLSSATSLQTSMTPFISTCFQHEW